MSVHDRRQVTWAVGEEPESARVRAAVTALRAEGAPRAAWREELHRALESANAVSKRAGRAPMWRVRPLAAIAAGVLCMVLGGGAMALVLGRGTAQHEDGRSVRFVLVAPAASRVSLVGDFNRWNPSATPMRRGSDGRTWTLSLPLAAGRHVYSFVVDGDLAADPSAPRAGDDDFGVPSSVVVVGGGQS